MTWYIFPAGSLCVYESSYQTSCFISLLDLDIASLQSDHCSIPSAIWEMIGISRNYTEDKIWFICIEKEHWFSSFLGTLSLKRNIDLAYWQWYWTWSCRVGLILKCNVLHERSWKYEVIHGITGNGIHFITGIRKFVCHVVLASCPWGPATAHGVGILTELYVICMERSTSHRAIVSIGP